jgi:hypothetical protein
MSDMVIYSDVSTLVGTTDEQSIWIIYEIVHEGETYYIQSSYWPEGEEREAHRQTLIDTLFIDEP